MALLRRLSATLSALVIASFLFAPPASAAPAEGGPIPSTLTECSTEDYHDDQRLGPERLPVLGDVGFQLLGYQRTGGMSPENFLAQYWDPAANGGQGGWRYPPQDGYVVGPDGKPIEFQLTMLPGTRMDRYGSEYGSYLAPDGLPYASRSIPPSSLDSNPAASCNYHDYVVLKSFRVDAGPIAPWFGQPGGGLQYQLNAALLPDAPQSINVMYLVNNGYLARAD